MIYGNKYFNENTTLAPIYEASFSEVVKKIIDNIKLGLKKIWDFIQKHIFGKKEEEYADGYKRMSQEEFEEWAKKKFGDDENSGDSYKSKQEDDGKEDIYNINSYMESDIDEILNQGDNVCQFMKNNGNKDNNAGDKAVKISEDVAGKASTIVSSKREKIDSYDKYQDLLNNTEKLKATKKKLLKKISMYHTDNYTAKLNEAEKKLTQDQESAELKEEVENFKKDFSRLTKYSQCLNQLYNQINNGISKNNAVINRMRAEFEKINNNNKESEEGGKA